MTTMLQKKRPYRYLIVWMLTLPWDLVTYLLVLLFWALYGTQLRWESGLWCALKTTSWPMRTWFEGYSGLTLGHGGWYSLGASGGPGIDTPTEFHEHIHVEQYEVGMAIAFFLSAIQFIAMQFFGVSLMQSVPICVGTWSFGWLVFISCGWLVAWLRGESAYLGSQHEEAAYAMVQEYQRKKAGR